jgi:hypothetical protein
MTHVAASAPTDAGRRLEAAAHLAAVAVVAIGAVVLAGWRST